jgi:tetratricopeptide (TPR) repeat protein
MAGRLRRKFPYVENPSGFKIFPDEPPVEGRSLGVAACAALVSRQTHVAVRPDTAASAIVDSDGKLHAVEHLAEKLRALHRSHSDVTTVVVAAGQKDTPTAGIRLVPCELLEDALRALGIDACNVIGECRGDHERRLEDFKVFNREHHDAAKWKDLAHQAWETMHAFRTEPADPKRAARAASFAALFFLHAGDGPRAGEILNSTEASGDPLPDQVRVWRSIVQATQSIDEEFGRDTGRAVDLAEEALGSCRRLLSYDQDPLLGMALGTFGRALLHANRFQEAEVPLRDAYKHHRCYDDDCVERGEQARSACYLATCLRLQGRALEALSVVKDAEKYCRPYRQLPIPGSTLLYLSLEHGRCLLALGRPENALRAFKAAVESDGDHPKVSALRGMAQAQRALGSDRAAWEKTMDCLTIANRARERNEDLVANLALLAVGDALLVEQDPQKREKLRRAWLQAYPSDDPEMIARLTRNSIY